jgi:hypothetical protein
VDHVDGQPRVAQRSGEAAPVAAMVQHPLGVLAEQRKLQAAREGHREAARTGLEDVVLLAGLQPQRRALERTDGLPAGRRQPRLPDRSQAGGRTSHQRRECIVQVGARQRFDRERVGRGLPGWPLLRALQQPRQVRAGDCAGRADAVEQIVQHAHRLFPGRQLREWRNEPQQRALLAVDPTAVETTLQLDEQETHQERAPGLGLECGQGVEMQRKRRLRTRYVQATAHQCDVADAGPLARHRRRPGIDDRRRAGQVEFRELAHACRECMAGIVEFGSERLDRGGGQGASQP